MDQLQATSNELLAALLRFLVRLVLAAAVTELLELQTAGGRLLVLRRRVVPLLALSALQCDDFPHLLILTDSEIRRLFAANTGSPSYLIISLMAPAPTVRPPSRMAKRRPFSMATGVISSTFSSTL